MKKVIKSIKNFFRKISGHNKDSSSQTVKIITKDRGEFDTYPSCGEKSDPNTELCLEIGEMAAVKIRKDLNELKTITGPFPEIMEAIKQSIKDVANESEGVTFVIDSAPPELRETVHVQIHHPMGMDVANAVYGLDTTDSLSPSMKKKKRRSSGRQSATRLKTAQIVDSEEMSREFINDLNNMVRADMAEKWGVSQTTIYRVRDRIKEKYGKEFGK